MLTPEQTPINTPFPTSDPLTVGFMSGGQMEYLPQQQYLTPAQYGAFRTLPPAVHQYAQYQNMNMFQSAVYANAGRFPGLDIPMPTYNPMVNMMHRQEFAKRRQQDTTIAPMGALADFAFGGAAAMVGGPWGLAAGMLLSPAAPFIEAQAQSRAIQNMTIPKIVSGDDVDKRLGMGFNRTKALDIHKFIRSSAAKDAFLKEDDYREIMRLGIEHNMFDYSNSADAYKKVLKRLRNQTDVMLEIADDKSLEGVMKNFKRFQTMGARAENFETIARQENMFARMSGMRHTDMVEAYGQQGALIYSQHGMTGYQGSLSAMSTAASLTMSQRLGLIDPGTVARYGGISGMTQTIVGQEAGMWQDKASMILPALANADFSDIDQGKLHDLITGKLSIQGAMSETATRVSDPTAFVSYKSNEAQLLEKMLSVMKEDQKTLMLSEWAKELGRLAGVQEGKAQYAAGYQILGFSPEMSGVLASQMTNPEHRRALEKSAADEERARQMKAESMAQHRAFMSIPTSISSWWNDTVTTPLTNAFNKAFTAIVGTEGEQNVKVGGAADVGSNINNQYAPQFMGSGTYPTKSSGGGVPSGVVSKDMQVRFDSVADDIEAAASKTGVDSRFLKSIAGSESGYDPTATSKDPDTGRPIAHGLFQFVKGTWKDMITKYGGKYGLTMDNSSPYNPEHSSLMAAEYVAELQRNLERTHGREMSNEEVYAGYVFGEGGSRKLLRALKESPNTLAKDVLSPSAVKNNKGLLQDKRTGRWLTVTEFVEALSRRFSRFDGLEKSTDTPQQETIGTFSVEDSAKFQQALKDNPDVAAHSVVSADAVSSDYDLYFNENNVGRSVAEVNKILQERGVEPSSAQATEEDLHKVSDWSLNPDFKKVYDDLKSKNEWKEVVSELALNVPGTPFYETNKLQDAYITMSKASRTPVAEYKHFIESLDSDISEFEDIVAAKTRGMDFKTFTKTGARDILKLMSKRNSLGWSDEDINEKLQDEKVLQHLYRAYGSSHKEELEEADILQQAKIRDKQRIMNINVQAQMDRVTEAVADMTASRDDAEKLMGLNKKNGITFELASVQKKLQLLDEDETTEQQRDQFEKEILDTMDKLRVKDEDVQRMFTTGSISALNMQGISKDELWDIHDIINKSSKDVTWRFDAIGQRVRNITGAGAALLAQEELQRHGLAEEDYSSQEQVEALLQDRTISGTSRKALENLRSLGDNIGNADLRTMALAQAVDLERAGDVKLDAVVPTEETTKKVVESSEKLAEAMEESTKATRENTEVLKYQRQAQSGDVPAKQPSTSAPITSREQHGI